MKKIATILVIFITTLTISFYFLKQEITTKPSIIKNKNIQNRQQSKIKKTVFLTHWNLKNIDTLEDKYDQIVYFGIKPNSQGIDTNDSGYLSINKIKDFRNKILAVNLTNQEFNLILLENSKLQDLIIKDTLDIAKKNNFKGLLINLEVSPSLSKLRPTQISNFIEKASKETRLKNLSFSMTFFGDNFYKVRPYDIKKLEPYVDTAYIMAYDFHKPNGMPGPNFPFFKNDVYDYDFQTMVNDFLKFIPPEKINIIYGMYGYDWIVDEKKRPINQASAITLNQIRDKFISKCDFKNCLITRDKTSFETEINYIDTFLNYHIIWFEDEDSVNKKTSFLKKKSINNVSFWANGYF